ncbi:MAG TPA: serine--tRNA ligase [Candidatus Poseidoniales archaeon]|jgi:seryl-tRNA synthetase|nr:MAG: serine--tRNA ligase [Euryarchaeota archaeon]HIF45416.1 serine--tRNA ligase [Candidatus Poseidoniales archaeon]HIL65295.1 serine--tRNA ligase [Candidatus Poseidoniales archaeon]
MLNMDLFRNGIDKIRADHDKRGLEHTRIDQVIRLDDEWKDALKQMEDARRERNQAARGISEAKKNRDTAAADTIMAEVKNIGAKISQLDEQANSLLEQRDIIRMRIPNILHEAVPIGADEGGNTQHSLHGEKPQFDFEPRTHNELIEMNKWVELERAAKIAGSRFFFLKGDLARMELALQSFAVDFIINRGFTFVQPPVMMNRKAYEGVTDLSDFETVMYGITPDPLYMIATSEHPLTAMFMDEIIEPSLLPIKMVGVSSCFRREVGAHGLSDKGIWRVHQFTKIEQIIICKPDDSWQHHEDLLDNCTDLWDALGLHYEVVNICTGDMGTVAARKYDLEAWLPGADAYKEIVSCSNCTDYQANRLSMRFRTNEGNTAVHTLNSTAVATSRALVAIMEQNQLKDGRVAVPECLVPLMGGKTHLEPCQW